LIQFEEIVGTWTGSNHKPSLKTRNFRQFITARSARTALSAGSRHKFGTNSRIPAENRNGKLPVLSPPIPAETRSQSPRAAEIFSRAKISHVFEAFRGVASWRADAKGLNVSLDGSRGVWHDFVSGDRGGILCLIMRQRGCSKQDALRWLADFTGIALEDRPLTADERARFAEQSRRLNRELPKARHWKRGDRHVRGVLDANHPQLTTGMVLSAQTKELAEMRALQVYIGMHMAEASAA
jgi:hypothetical protein